MTGKGMRTPVRVRREGSRAAEERLQREVVRQWKDRGAGNPPLCVSLEDDIVWLAAVEQLIAWGDMEAAALVKWLPGNALAFPPAPVVKEGDGA